MGAATLMMIGVQCSRSCNGRDRLDKKLHTIFSYWITNINVIYCFRIYLFLFKVFFFLGLNYNYTNEMEKLYSFDPL